MTVKKVLTGSLLGTWYSGSDSKIIQWFACYDTTAAHQFSGTFNLHLIKRWSSQSGTVISDDLQLQFPLGKTLPSLAEAISASHSWCRYKKKKKKKHASKTFCTGLEIKPLNKLLKKKKKTFSPQNCCATKWSQLGPDKSRQYMET